MIKLAFYWHQHQPYYKDNLTGEYFMPWVRLHGIKDYIGMVLLLEEFPEIHQTFNYVPCLLDQIGDYEESRAKDSFWKLTKILVADLTEENKLYILNNFFSANRQTMIDVYPRYRVLREKRNLGRKRAQEVVKGFSNKDFQDLQVWANLAWFHPLIFQKDTLLSDLVKKAEGFTQEDKELVLSKQIEVLKQIVPLHKRFQDLKQIEITTSPYYHPILPLLCDQGSAKTVLPKLSLPENKLSAPEDAKVQVERAVLAYEKSFGRKPRGLWPSEGAVSDDVIPIVSRAGFHWLASDEEILACSLGIQIQRNEYGDVTNPDILYKPYRINIKGSELVMVFRDHNLSDAIGFQYSKYNADFAVTDFMNRINTLKRYNDTGKPLLVTIILDGENAWEYYPNSGVDFLRKLYRVIEKDCDIECVRISDYLDEYPPEQTLGHVSPGSWIGHNLATWIGHEEKNAAWDLIETTRSFLVNRTDGKERLSLGNVTEKAWEEIFIAEGSDWFWWFGDDHVTDYKDEFDSLFRLHLRNVYTLFNEEIPGVLEVPIAKIEKRKPYTYPKRFLDVKLDGVVSSYFEWLEAGEYNASKDMDTMHRTYGQIITAVYFGFTIENVLIRVDFNKELFPQYREKGNIVITFIQPHEVQICTSLLMEKPLWYVIKDKSQNYNRGCLYSIALNKIMELSCNFGDLHLFPGMDVEFFLEFIIEGKSIQRIPLRTVFCFSVPTKDFERIMWQV